MTCRRVTATGRMFAVRSKPMLTTMLTVTLATMMAMAACSRADDAGDSHDATAPLTIPTTNVLSTRFDAVHVQLAAADGAVCDLCLWRADTEAERRRGLQGVTELAGADGMAFVFETPSRGGFWMKDTLIPLDVAYYDATGAFLALDTMQPCPDGTADCPIYAGASDYTLAIEVPAGRAAEYGMEPGGRVTLVGPCDPAADGSTGSGTDAAAPSSPASG